MAYSFKNLVFEGGGVKGIAYVGALKELEDRGILQNVERVGGTSAGAINAVLLSLGYTLQETQKVLSDLQFKNFMDDSWGVVRDTNRLIEKYGWYKGDFFRSWIGELIRKKLDNENATFNDFRNGDCLDLYLVGTNLSTRFAEVFSYEHTPRMRVVDAVRISMSIPLFFAAVRDKIRDDVYVDGGVLNNYPVKLFDREKYLVGEDQDVHAVDTEYYASANESAPQTSSKYVFNKQTLGFKLDSGQEIAVFRDGAEPVHTKIDDFFDYAQALVKTILSAQDNRHLHSDDWARTVYINTIGVSSTDFDIANATKKRLVEEGSKGTQKYFEWYDNQ